MEKKLRLIAIANRWHIREAEEEIGDSLYIYDRKCLELRLDPEYPLIYVYSCLESSKVFNYIIQEPPAYIERIVPVQIIYKQVIRLMNEDLLHSGSVFDILRQFVRARCGESCLVEAHPRNFYIVYRDKLTRRQAQKYVQKMIASYLGVRIDRKAKYSLILEDTRLGIIGAILLRGTDRIRYWRRRRLSLDT